MQLRNNTRRNFFENLFRAPQIWKVQKNVDIFIRFCCYLPLSSCFTSLFPSRILCSSPHACGNQKRRLSPQVEMISRSLFGITLNALNNNVPICRICTDTHRSLQPSSGYRWNVRNAPERVQEGCCLHSNHSVAVEYFYCAKTRTETSADGIPKSNVNITHAMRKSRRGNDVTCTRARTNAKLRNMLGGSRRAKGCAQNLCSYRILL